MNGDNQENATMDGDDNTLSNGECLNDEVQELMDDESQQVSVEHVSFIITVC